MVVAFCKSGTKPDAQFELAALRNVADHGTRPNDAILQYLNTTERLTVSIPGYLARCGSFISDSPSCRRTFEFCASKPKRLCRHAMSRLRPDNQGLVLYELPHEHAQGEPVVLEGCRKACHAPRNRDGNRAKSSAIPESAITEEEALTRGDRIYAQAGAQTIPMAVLRVWQGVLPENTCNHVVDTFCKAS